jgi:hypothetical protein
MARASRVRRATELGLLLGVAGSLAAHALLFALLHLAGTLPSVDFELQMPSEVEFGMTEPAAAPPSSPEANAAAAPASSQAEPTAVLAEGPKPKPKPKPKPRPELPDAGAPDTASAAQSDAAPVASGPPLLSAYAPEGSQIALRLHMGRVRDSELAPEVRRLFEALVDFRMILEGSGLDPLRDLERLYIATPDLRRANLVIAGQYLGDPELPERAVASLAAARGQAASFRREGSIRVAPWLNLDATPRVVALIAPHQFAITRDEDLPRVLQVARALAARRAREGVRRDPAEALLALDEGETLALSVEGARAFARGNLRGVPERLEAKLRSQADGTIEVRVQGFYEDEAAARSAAEYWQRVRDRYAANLLVAAIGLRAPLAETSITAEADRIELRSVATVQHARVVLGFISNALAPPPAPPDPPVEPTEPRVPPDEPAKGHARPAPVNRPYP